MTTLGETKKKMREDLGALGGAVSPQKRSTDSVAICKRIRQQREWLYAKSVLLYAPLPGEADIWPLLQESLFLKRDVFLPRFDEAAGVYEIAQIRDFEKDIKPGKFGVREPAPEIPRSALKFLDLMLVPAVGFSLNGARLGRGGGHYDRLLAELDGPACGVAFDWQIVPGIPMEPHDWQVNMIVTPTQWHVVNQRRSNG